MTYEKGLVQICEVRHDGHTTWAKVSVFPPATWTVPMKAANFFVQRRKNPLRDTWETLWNRHAPAGFKEMRALDVKCDEGGGPVQEWAIVGTRFYRSGTAFGFSKKVATKMFCLPGSPPGSEWYILTREDHETNLWFEGPAAATPGDAVMPHPQAAPLLSSALDFAPHPTHIKTTVEATLRELGFFPLADTCPVSPSDARTFNREHPSADLTNPRWSQALRVGGV